MLYNRLYRFKIKLQNKVQFALQIEFLLGIFGVHSYIPPMEMTVRLPVRPSVYRFCISLYGTASIKVSHTVPAIYSAFQLLHHPEHYIDNRSEVFEKGLFIELIIPSELRKSNKFFLSDNHIRVFNGMIEGLLCEQLYQYLDLMTSSGLKINDSIESFKKNLGLEADDWASDTLKKKYYRHRRAREKTIKSFGKTSPEKTIK